MPSPFSLCRSLSYTYIYTHTHVFTSFHVLNGFWSPVCQEADWSVSRIPAWCLSDVCQQLPLGFLSKIYFNCRKIKERLCSQKYFWQPTVQNTTHPHSPVARSLDSSSSGPAQPGVMRQGSVVETIVPLCLGSQKVSFFETQSLFQKEHLQQRWAIAFQGTMETSSCITLAVTGRRSAGKRRKFPLSC